MDQAVAGFLTELYEQGLAEFAYVNQLDLSGVISFAANSEPESAGVELDLPERALVAMGGGKDSLVCLQMLREAGMEVQAGLRGWLGTDRGNRKNRRSAADPDLGAELAKGLLN